MVPGAGEEDVRLDLRAERGGQGMGVLAVDRVETLVGVAPHAPVGALDEALVALLGELHRVALGVLDGGELQVGIVELAEDLLGGAGDLARLRQQLLDLRRAHVGALPAQVIEVMGVDLQTGFALHPFGQGFRRQGEDLRREEGAGGRGLDPQRDAAVGHGHEFGVGCILVPPQAGVADQLVEQQGELVGEFDASQEALRAPGQGALAGRQLRNQGVCLGKLLLPQGVVGVNALQVPGQLPGDFTALGHGLHRRGASRYDSGTSIIIPHQPAKYGWRRARPPLAARSGRGASR